MSGATETTKLPERKDVPVELQWDLDVIFATDEAWESEYSALKQEYSAVSQYKGKLGRGTKGNNLLAALTLKDQISERVERLYVYAHLRNDQDTTATIYQSMFDKAKTLAKDFSAACAYIVPEILSIKPERLEQFLQKNSGLAVYRHALDDISRNRAHTLDAKTEEILANSADLAMAPKEVFKAFDNADLELPEITGADGKKTRLTHGNYLVFLQSPDRNVRQAAFEAMMGSFCKWRNTLATNYSAKVKANIFYSRTRGHKSCLEAALHHDNIPVSVYSNLLASVEANLPKLHRYLELRKRILAVDKLHMWDLYVPLLAEVKYKFTYDQARELVLEAVKPLGNDYCQALRTGLTTARWADVMETRGKRSGAYSSGAFGTNPNMLLNWQEELHDAFTLAHEAGHSMQTYYTHRNQPYPYADYTIFVAEVASTFNEGLLTHHLLETSKDDTLKAYILNNELEEIRLTLFRQTLFAEFEKEAHALAEAGVPLTAEKLGQGLHTGLNNKYYGAVVEIDHPIHMEWARIPHFYNSFYVFKYATGISAAKTLVRRVLTEGEPARKAYLNFLASGSSKYSIDLLKDAGVDMTTTAPVDQTMIYFEERLNQLEALLKN